MATPSPGVWGIDIGQCAFKAIRLEVIEGTVTATAFDYIEHPKILSQPDADPDLLTREALDKFLERNNLRGDTVVIGIPGQSGLARFVKLPPVEEKKIGDIVRFEAKQQIPFPLEEVIWDFQKIGSGLVTDGFAMETEIGLFAMKKDVIHRFLQHFLDVHIEVHVVQMAPLALCNFISFELLGKNPLKTAEAGGEGEGSTAIQASPDAAGKRRCVVALDIGADNSNLVITDGEKIIWQRPIPLGGNHFTRALTKEMKLTFAKAEHLKRNATKSPDLKKILASLKPVLNEFVGEVQRSLGYFTNTHRDSHVEYMMGLGNAFRLPGLQKYLSEKLSLDVRKLGNLTNLSGESVFNVPAFSNNVMSFAMAYGLAVQGLNLSRIHTNLLPQEIRTERDIRAKKPWAVATAAALLLGISASLAGYAMQYHAVAAAAVVDEMKQDKALMEQINKLNGEYTAKEAKCKENETAIRGFIAGQDERLNWILLNRFLNECMPVPALRVEGRLELLDPQGKCVVLDSEGKKHDFTIDDKATFLMVGNKFVLEPAEKAKLKKGDAVAVVYHTDENLKKYWGNGNKDTLEAYRSYWNRQTLGKGGTETKTEDEGVEDLIQINVESMYAMYTTDLPGYFANVQRVPNYTDFMVNATEKTKAPEGKGWVVELRGYTYHKERKRFIMDTLLTTLNAKGAKPPEAAAGAAAATPEATAAATPPAEAKPAEAKPADAADADKPKESGEVKPDPFTTVIQGKISHVFLADYLPVSNPQPGQFAIIGSTVLPKFLTAALPMAGGMAPGGDSAGSSAAMPGGGDKGDMPGGGMAMGMGGMGGPMGTAWTPLTAISGADAGGMMGMGGMGGMAAMMGKGGFGGMNMAPGGAIMGGAGGDLMDRARQAGINVPGMPGAAPGLPGAAAPGAPGVRRVVNPTRSEFIVLFIWQEPTPTDDRLDGGAGAAPGAAAPAAAPSPADAPPAGSSNAPGKAG